MDFSLVKKWTIQEGDVLSVTDSKNNLLWSAPLQWNLETGSTLTVTSLVDFSVMVINSSGEDFFITYPDWINYIQVSSGTVGVNDSETSGYKELDVSGVVGRCLITFNPVRTNIIRNKDFLLQGPSKDLISSVTITK